MSCPKVKRLSSYQREYLFIVTTWKERGRICYQKIKVQT
jgi:hypothetical protein